MHFVKDILKKLCVSNVLLLEAVLDGLGAVLRRLGGVLEGCWAVVGHGPSEIMPLLDRLRGS